MGQATELLQIDDRVVFAPTGVTEDVTLPQRRGHRPVDAAGDPEAELGDATAEGDARLLGREPAVEEVAGHRLAAERVAARRRWLPGITRNVLERGGGRIVGKQID